MPWADSPSIEVEYITPRTKREFAAKLLLVTLGGEHADESSVASLVRDAKELIDN